MTANLKKILTIGMPVYNGEVYLALAIESLLAQDFSHWELMIFDNHSTDSSWNIITSFAASDPRISCFRREENVGAIRNFIELIENAESQYFMWAAADDTWSSNYISSCLSALEANREIGFAGGSIRNTDGDGNTIRTYDPFLGGADPVAKVRIKSFLQAVEVDGKANMIYSIFRTDLLKHVCTINAVFNGWGFDMALVLASLSRASYLQVGQSILYKRVVSFEDIQTAKLLSDNQYAKIQFNGDFPPKYFYSYVRGLLSGLPSVWLKFFAVRIMLCRLVGVLWRKGWDVAK